MYVIKNLSRPRLSMRVEILECLMMSLMVKA